MAERGMEWPAVKPASLRAVPKFRWILKMSAMRIVSRLLLQHRVVEPAKAASLSFVSANSGNQDKYSDRTAKTESSAGFPWAVVFCIFSFFKKVSLAKINTYHILILTILWAMQAATGSSSLSPLANFLTPYEIFKAVFLFFGHFGFLFVLILRGVASRNLYVIRPSNEPGASI